MKARILQGDFDLPDFLSEEARDLIKSVLRLDPLKRPSIKAMLSHPWFAKVFAPTLMETLEEKDDSSGFENQLQGQSNDITATEKRPFDATAASLLAAHILTSETKGTIPQEHAAETLQGLGVDLGTSTGSTSSISNISKISDDDSSVDLSSDQTDSTGPTSLDESAKVQSESTPSIDARANEGSRTLLQRNESQATIRKGSLGSSYGTRPNSLTLPTHHETTSLRPMSPRLRAVEEPGPLVKQNSQSSSRSHQHRTPSRTKRRSSSGLSDHHLHPPPTQRTVDFCAMLQQEQPALFSTVLEQTLLHQLGNLGFDVGQTVHSILTDACDASAAMWWLLKARMEDRQEAEKYLRGAPGMASGLSASSSLKSAFVPPPIPQKDPSRSAAGPEDQQASQTPTLQIDGPSASETKEKTIDTDGVLQGVGDSQAPRSADQSHQSAGAQRPTVSSRSATTPNPTDPTTLPSVASKDFKHASPQSGEGRTRSFFSSPPDKQSPESRSAAGEGKPIGKGRPARDRANSLSMKLASVLTRRESTNVPEVPKISFEGERPSASGSGVAGTSTGSGSVSSSMAGLFSRKGSSGNIMGKGKDKDPSVGERAVSGSTLSNSSTSSLSVAAAESEGKRRSQVRDSGTSVRGSPTGLPMSPSVDTFLTVSSGPTDDSQTKDAPTHRTQNKSSFFSAVRNWLGTEDRQSRRRKKKVAAGVSPRVGEASPRIPAVGNMSRQSSVRSRSGQYSAYASVGPGSGSRRQPRTPAAKTTTNRSAHRLSVSSGEHAPAYLTPSATATEMYRAPAWQTPGVQSRPSPLLRRQSGGSVTPTALYGERPSRAPSSSSLYRASGGGVPIGRTSSIHSNHSAGIKRYSGYGLPPSSAAMVGGSNTMSGGSSPLLRGGSIRSSRQMSSEGGTLVLRQRASRKQASRQDSSRPSSMIELPPPAVSEASSMLDNGAEPGSGAPSATPSRRTSIDSRRGVGGADWESLHASGGRSSPSVFLAHRTRQTYKPPSANPALHGQSHLGGPSWRRSAMGHSDADPNLIGVWQGSWGRPPPSWSGPVDSSSHSRSDLALLNAARSRMNLRDVFSGKARAAQKDEDGGWTDDDGEVSDGEGRGEHIDEPEPVFSGGLGQLDSKSARAAAAAGTTGTPTPMTSKYTNAMRGGRQQPTGPNLTPIATNVGSRYGNTSNSARPNDSVDSSPLARRGTGGWPTSNSGRNGAASHAPLFASNAAPPAAFARYSGLRSTGAATGGLDGGVPGSGSNIASGSGAGAGAGSLFNGASAKDKKKKRAFMNAVTESEESEGEGQWGEMDVPPDSAEQSPVDGPSGHSIGFEDGSHVDSGRSSSRRRGSANSTPMTASAAFKTGIVEEEEEGEE